MRAQAIENLLKLMILCDDLDDQKMENLKAKGRILLDRASKDESVVRELLNMKVEL